MHIAIIMDGNRRYAKKHKLETMKGHIAGVKKAEEVLEWCQEFGIKELTLYSFSIENFERSKTEVDYLMNLFDGQINNLLNDKRVFDNKIKIRFIGRKNLFPAELLKGMKLIEEKTSGFDKFRLNFAIGYGGRQEIVDAVNKLISEGKEIDEEAITKELYLPDFPDLLIRTGGEKRISNFLLWQSAYTELYFSDRLWPEFSKEDFIAALEDFKARERRFGK